MPHSKIAICCSRRSIFIALRIAVGLLALASSAARAQQSEFDVGIIVVKTADQANRALAELKAGKDFRGIAKVRSVDSTAGDGGDMGRLRPASLRPEFRDALKSLKPGQVTGVIPFLDRFAILTIFPLTPNPPATGENSLPGGPPPVRNMIGIAGFNEADDAFQQFPQKPNGWERHPDEICSIRQESVPYAITAVEKLLADAEGPSPNPSSSLQESDALVAIEAHTTLAQLHAYNGEMDKAVKEFQTAYQYAEARSPRSLPFLQEALGVTYLHLAEMENGSYRGSGTIDFFPPIDPHAHFSKPDNSKLAIEYFLRYLEHNPDDREVKWLLNLAYQTLGEYPSGVPSKYLVAEMGYDSREMIGRFKDVAPAAGLNLFLAAGGVAIDDFENNGLLDIIILSMYACDSLHYLHNNGDGTFSDRTAQAGLSNQLGALQIVAADYNNDGCLDFLLLRGGWEFPMRRSLMRNNCDGTFTDVTQQSGLEATVTASQTAAWADIDNDGYLDLFVGSEKGRSQLFHNKGDGTFEDISHSAGIDELTFAKGVTAADYDKDGYVDFFVSVFNGTKHLYHNNHNLTFTDVAKQAGVEDSTYSFSTWFFDYDNDGWPDIFMAGYNINSIDDVLRSYEGQTVPEASRKTLKLFRNMHNGTFQDVTAQVGLERVFMPMGSNFGDIDNDGFLDIYLGMGSPSFVSLMPHVLLHNKEGKSFVDVTASSGTGEIHKGHGIAFADLERRGQEDIVAEIGGAVPADRHTLRVFRNPGNDNDWINVKLIGVKSNRSAIGAEIKVTVENDHHGSRSIYRTVGETSSFGGNPLERHIGLGHGARILSIDIWWPATNMRQHFTHVDKNQFISIKEFSSDYTALDRKPLKAPGTATVAVTK
jgi:FG-GAP-like repeat/ASPIC and UnbV/PPIC-type PPIASE domain